MNREDFKILNNITYLDNAATTQRPSKVIDSIVEYYNNYNANPHRGNYTLSLESTRIYDESRHNIAKFINANDNEIVFTKNATEALNLLAYSYGMDNIEKDDEVVISILEHHSNLVPWQRVTKNKNANLKYLYLDDNGMISNLDAITNKTKIVSITHISNALGTINPIKEIIAAAHRVGAIVILDASQSIPHMNIDVKELDVDFLVFSGHKLYSSLGIGVLYGKQELLDNMKPFLLGGDMIEYVHEQSATYSSTPTKFEAGTQNIEGAYSLSKAIDYINNIGMDKINKYERELFIYAYQELKKLDYIEIYGPKDINNQTSIISFNIKGIHPHDVSSILDQYHICVRTGNHCAQPLMEYLKIDSTIRMSISFYNNLEDINNLINALKASYEVFKKWVK